MKISDRRTITMLVILFIILLMDSCNNNSKTKPINKNENVNNDGGFTYHKNLN